MYMDKKNITQWVVFFWLPLLDSLFCGKATAVATVHRPVPGLSPASQQTACHIE